MHPKKTLKMWVLLGLVGALAGCGKDRTVDDYNAQKQNQEQQQSQKEIGGTFNGVLVSTVNGEAMGSLSIKVSSDTLIQDTGARSTIAAEIVLTTKKSSQRISVPTGYYNIYTHAYQLDFSVGNVFEVDPAGKTVMANFRVKGKIDPVTGIMDGTIAVVDRAKYGGKFRLTKDGNAPELEDTHLPTERADAALGKTYRARPKVMGTPDMLTLRFSSSAKSEEGEFMDLFYPVRYLDISAVLSETYYGDELLRTKFLNCEWDLQSKTLTGDVVDNTGSRPAHYSIQCRESGTAKRPAWKCSWSGTLTFDFTAKGVQ